MLIHYLRILWLHLTTVVSTIFFTELSSLNCVTACICCAVMWSLVLFSVKIQLNLLDGFAILLAAVNIPWIYRCRNITDSFRTTVELNGNLAHLVPHSRCDITQPSWHLIWKKKMHAVPAQCVRVDPAKHRKGPQSTAKDLQTGPQRATKNQKEHIGVP